MDAVSLLFAILKLTALFMAVKSSAGQTCSRSYVNGRWITSENCEGELSIESIMSDLKKRAEKEHVEAPQSGPSNASDSVKVVTGSTLKTTTRNSGDETSTVFSSDSTSIQPTDVTTSTTAACQSSHFKFPNRNHKDYVQYNGSEPRFGSFAACVWLRIEEIDGSDTYGVMSYCTNGSFRCETLLVVLSSIRMTVFIEKESGQTNFGYKINVSQWTYACIVMSRSLSRYYINGSFNSVSGRTLNERIPNGGVLILGNAQGTQIKGKSPGEPTDGSHGFYGEMREFQLWNRELTGNEIEDLFKSGGCSCNTDSIVNFNESNSVIKGNVLALWNTTCP